MSLSVLANIRMIMDQQVHIAYKFKEITLLVQLTNKYLF